jgi:NAD(P)-dependent dehydrogenase (short-subunit alcohol dehydrogenase family)
MALADLFNLKGRTALVTGSARGIGKAIVLALAEAGADVVVHGVSNPAVTQQVAQEAAAFGVRAYAVQADMADPAGPRQLHEQAVQRLGRIDILVPNASVQIRRNWADISRDEFDLQVNVNLRATLQLIQLALPGMVERGWGRVLVVGSVQQVKPSPQMLVYAATKAALSNMVRNLAKQVAPHGVTVNNLAPGVFDTDRNADVMSDAELYASLKSRIPAGYFGEPSDCVGAALLLCSEAGRYITGADLLVDGGWALS